MLMFSEQNRQKQDVSAAAYRDIFTAFLRRDHPHDCTSQNYNRT